MYPLIIVFLCVLSVFSSAAQSFVLQPDTSHAIVAADSASIRNQKIPPVHSTRLALVGGFVVGSMTAIHIYQQNGWWKDNRRSFHFQEDLTYGRSVDKVGHFFGASLMAFGVRNALEWANVPETEALLYGSGVSLLFQTFIEVEDGFSTWGFDRVDFAADVGGVAWPVAQHYSPFLRKFDFKLSYWPSELINNPGGIGFKGQKHLMMDDYEGQTLWLGVRVNDFLPSQVEPYWPDFLGLALGFGARDVASTSGRSPYNVWFIALDYDMTKIIPQHTGFLRFLGRTLNFIHFPAPAVRISPSAIWYGVYF